MKYAGIGSRETPDDFCQLMRGIAAWLSRDRTTLRTGGAPGADDAFLHGWISTIDSPDPIPGMAELYLPWIPFNGWGETDRAAMLVEKPTPWAFDMAKLYHPAWGNLTLGAKALHARNMHIMLGLDLDDPVDAVICWTPGGRLVGGTAQALRVAVDFAIPVHNLANEDERTVIVDAIHEDNIDAIRR